MPFNNDPELETTLDNSTNDNLQKVEDLALQHAVQGIAFPETDPSSEDSLSVDMQEVEEVSQYDLSVDMTEVEDLASQHDLLEIIPQDVNPINAIIQYHLIDGEGHSSLKLELIKQSGLFCISILGVIFYYEPTKIYAESICADPTYKNIACPFFVDNHVAGTLLVAGGILMIATNSFIEQQSASYIPNKLKNYLKNPLTRKQKAIEDAVTIVGSFIASVPFIIITLVDPIPGLPKFLIFSQACIVGVTNTLLHLLPFKLAFQNKLYRAPFLPVEFIYQKISNFFLSHEEKRVKALQAQINRDQQRIKHAFINHLDQAKRLLSIYGFHFSGCGYKNKIINDFRRIKEQNHSPLQLLVQLLDRLHEISPDRPIPPSSRANHFFRKAVYFPGATWVILGCAGFWGGTFNEMTELTGTPGLAAIVSAPSIYCLGVLLAFFGGNALQNSYDYFTAWKDDTVKIPMAFKLYPKTSVLLIFISMYLSAFSYAAGAQLINDNFNDKLEFLRPHLLNLAKTGLTFLGFTAMLDFFNAVLSKFGQYGGDEDTQTVVQLSEALNQMKNSVQLMKSSLLLESLALMNKDQLKNILNINNKNDQQNFSKILFQLADNLKIKFLFNHESKVIALTENDVQFTRLLSQLKNDQFYTVEKIETLLNYLSHLELEELPLNLEEGQDYQYVCKIISTLDSVNLISALRNVSEVSIATDEDYAGPFTETATLIPSADRSVRASIQTIFFHPPRPSQFYADGNRAPYSNIV